MFCIVSLLHLWHLQTTMQGHTAQPWDEAGALFIPKILCYLWSGWVVDATWLTIPVTFMLCAFPDP